VGQRQTLIAHEAVTEKDMHLDKLANDEEGNDAENTQFVSLNLSASLRLPHRRTMSSVFPKKNDESTIIPFPAPELPKTPSAIELL
jgi:hypothetical protein